jgi:Flp pilus assembly protein CpaB
MEAEFSGESRRRRLLLISGGLLAIVAAVATFYLSHPAPSPPEPVAMQTVVVAAVDIPARTAITSAMLTHADMAASPMLSTVVADENDAIGKVTTVAISRNQLISFNLLGSGNPGGLTILSPSETIAPDSPAWRAISVLVPKERAVGGMLVAGEHVDLFTTFKLAVYDSSGALSNAALPSSGYISENTTKLTWSDVEILATNLIEDLYVLKVDEHQAEEIAHVQGSNLNGFSISLRPEADTRDIDRSGYGETTNRILEQYDFPVPQVIDLNGYPQPSPVPSPFSNVPWGTTPQPPPVATPQPAPTASPAPSASPSAAPTTAPPPTVSPTPSGSPLPTRSPRH